MVKNLHGGNKHKNQARKNVDSASSYNKLIISKQADEVYAIVTCLLGGNKCQVMTLQQKMMLCVIGGKFYKREFVRKGTWVLVGLREWDNSTTTTISNKKQQQCDLLEIYNEQNKIDLKNIVVDVNWKIFLDVDNNNNNNQKNNNNNTNDDDDFIEFSNQENDSYKQLMEQQINSLTTSTIKILQQEEEEEEINIDDI
jgi:initiation factor 1A